MILENQTFSVKNLISFRKQLGRDDLMQEMGKLQDYLTVLGAQRIASVINTVHGVVGKGEKLDTEIYVPIDKEIPSNDEFTFKKELLLNNCLKTSHEGNPDEMPKTMEALNQYIVENKFITISSIFTINVSDISAIADIEKFKMDIYVSVVKNTNII